MIQKKRQIPPTERINAGENRECEDDKQVDKREKEDAGIQNVVETELYCKGR